MVRHVAWQAVAVFLVSLIWLGAGVGKSGIASVPVDPVSHISSQDESVYSREAIEMVAAHDWLTPTFLGRPMLNKPPLLQMLTAWSISLFGISAWALRLPVLLAAAIAATLVFFLARRSHPLGAACCAWLLLLGSHLFYVYARLNMTDTLLMCWSVAALAVLVRDPALARRASPWVFGVLVGAAILTKGAAGAVPLIALGVYAAFGPHGLRPTRGRVWLVCLASAAVALPWHLYQLAIRPHWFIAEYLLDQHLSIGLTAPAQYSQENHLWFYFRRLVETDPVLMLAVLATACLAASAPVRRGLTRVFRSSRNSVSHAALPVGTGRTGEVSPLAAWMLATVAALFLFRHRSCTYLLQLLPLLALWSAAAFARLPGRVRNAAPLLAVLVVAAKVVAASPLWGISFQPTRQPLAPILEAYSARARGNELIVAGVDDDFYATLLPLPRVRYLLMAAPTPASARHPHLDFEWLGVTVPAAQFNDEARWRPVYEQRLRAWAGAPVDAVATVILAPTTADIAAVAAAHPGADFLLPEAIYGQIPLEPSHTVEETGQGWHLLLSRQRPGNPRER